MRVLFGPECGGVKEWREIPRSSFNILVSPWYSKSFADLLEQKYGQPYL